MVPIGLVAVRPFLSFLQKVRSCTYACYAWFQQNFVKFGSLLLLFLHHHVVKQQQRSNNTGRTSSTTLNSTKKSNRKYEISANNFHNLFGAQNKKHHPGIFLNHSAMPTDDDNNGRTSFVLCPSSFFIIVPSSIKYPRYLH